MLTIRLIASSCGTQCDRPLDGSNKESCYRQAMTFLRIVAWLLSAAVTFVTLGPPQYRPHSALGQAGEHALAFLLVGLAFGLAYPRRRLLIAGIAVVLIGMLELLQLWMPGRHARWEDFIVDAIAACAGIAAAAMLDRLTSRQRSKNNP
jgi:VanZ family protein